MRSYKYHYTYLITNLTPTNKKQFYIGVKSCNCLPAENIDYMGSSSALAEDIKLLGVNNFEKIIIAEFNSRDEAETHELMIHKEYDVVNDPQYYNKKNGNIGFHVTPESILKCTQIFNDPIWKSSKRKAQSQSDTLNDPIWKEVAGLEKIKKYKRTINDPLWIAANTFICEHCNLSIIKKNNYNRWHGNNCKLKEK